MIKKNSTRFHGIFFSALLCTTGSVTAEIHQGNAFLYGDNIEVGLGPDGAFGSDVISPDTERKAHGKRLGYISDPTGGKFDNDSYHGDFFLPGYPEEGWGIRFDGKTYNNNSNQQGSEIIGGLLDFNTTASNQNVTWKGEVEGLEITQVFRVYTLGTAIVFDITLKNTTSIAMNDVYYLRTVDPDNNAEQDPGNSSAKYSTTNTILSQGFEKGGYSAVSAMQEANSGTGFSFTKSLLTLNGYGENSRVTFGDLFVRAPENVYNGTGILKQTGSVHADQAISLAFKFDKIAAGDTVTFRAGYQLKDVPVADLDINSSDTTGNEFSQLYFIGSEAVKVADTDTVIEGTGFDQIQEATVTITNPHAGDILSVLGALPTGITLETAVSSDTKIFLSGVASRADYQTALMQVLYKNDDFGADLETRKITLQVIDDNATPSNTAISTVKITIPVVLTDLKIAGDDIVNGDEVDAVKFTGKAAPNSTITIDFTDKNGKKLAPPITVTTDENGDWNLDDNPADISSLSDGPIEVLITATDPNGNVTKLTHSILKDTIIILKDITPVDDETVSSATPTFKGKTDPNATVVLKILPDGKSYTTTADNDGNWEIKLDKQPMGETQSVKITATDPAGNVISTTQKFHTPKLPLDVTDLDTNELGVANSLTPVIKGTSNPDTTITLSMPTTNGKTATCTTKTDADGKWECKLPSSPSGGPYTLTVTTEDSNGDTNSTTKELTIPDLPLVIDSPTDNAVISGINPEVAGTSKPGSKITVLASNGEKCTAVTDSKNHWSCKLPTLGFDKTFKLTITTEDDLGNSTTKEVNVSTDKLPLAVISPQDNSTAEDSTPVFTGTSAPKALITVKFASGQECKTETDADGNWSCEVPALPVGGPYDVTITAEDADGNTSIIDESISIPRISLVVITPEEGEKITDTEVLVSGTNDPNTKIVALGPDGESCETISDNNGKWSCTLEGLQSGNGKRITVISGEGAKQKVKLTTIDIENSSEGVRTILTGGAGSSSAPFLLLLGIFLFIKRKRNKA